MEMAGMILSINVLLTYSAQTHGGFRLGLRDG